MRGAEPDLEASGSMLRGERAVRALLVVGLLLGFVGCSQPGSPAESDQGARLRAAHEEIERLRSLVAKERALRAIDEIRHRGKVEGEAERILDLLLRSDRFVDRAQGRAVLAYAVERVPSYYPSALRRVRELQRNDPDGFWKEFERTLARGDGESEP